MLVRTVQDPRTISLTKKEKQVMIYVTVGYTQEEICKKLNVAANTVKSHLRHMYNKFGIRDQRDLAVTCILYELVDINKIRETMESRIGTTLLVPSRYHVKRAEE